MVFKFQFQPWGWLSLLVLIALPSEGEANSKLSESYLAEAARNYRTGKYFRAARYAFAGAQLNPSVKPRAYSWMTTSLIRAGLFNSATYFFIRTLQGGDRSAIRRVLTETQNLYLHVGGDLIQRYLMRHTKIGDYDDVNKSTYLYSLGKNALLRGKEREAIRHFSRVKRGSLLYPFALQMRATAYAILGKPKRALRDFERCASGANQLLDASLISGRRISALWAQQQRDQAKDLESRCDAGRARVYYETNQFAEAERAYDLIPKSSFVWTDILFERAWNSFAQGEFNRALGRLVSYKSPSLSFVFNSEVDVLRAQSYLALCLYNDANIVINEFNRKYGRAAKRARQFLDKNRYNLSKIYEVGKTALRNSLHTRDDFFRLLNRFIRSPYFQNLVYSEKAVDAERAAIKKFDSFQKGVPHDLSKGFPGFLEQVLRWRGKAIRLMGGAYVKNSLLDHYSILISDFEKMSFIKIEMLKRTKETLLTGKRTQGLRARGNEIPGRRDDQFFWEFNGEFWTDELGDYVFGLESKCRT